MIDRKKAPAKTRMLMAQIELEFIEKEMLRYFGHADITLSQAILLRQRGAFTRDFSGFVNRWEALDEERRRLVDEIRPY